MKSFGSLGNGGCNGAHRDGSRLVFLNEGSWPAVQLRSVLVLLHLQDVADRLDAKAAIEDVNKALLEVCNELETKATSGDVQQLQGSGAGASSGCAGRWLWKTGNLKTNKCVPWNVQALNTQPTALQWERDVGQVRRPVRQVSLHCIALG